MKSMCKNCKNFFNHHQNYLKQGFCRRFNNVQISTEINENCFTPNKETEIFHRNKASAKRLGIDVGDLPKSIDWKDESLSTWFANQEKKQEKKENEQQQKAAEFENQLSIFES